MPPKVSFKLSSFVIIIVGISILGMIVMYVGSPKYSEGSYIKLNSLTGGKSQQVLIDKTLAKSSESLIVVKQKSKSIIDIKSGLPLRVEIPKINVNTTIKQIGITPQGAMDMSKGATDVVWYNLGPRPGNTGSAVIAGHYGVWKDGRISVFHDLYTLSKGDKIYIENDKGELISFVVRKSQMYDSNDDTSNVFSSNDGKSHLNIITCGGIRNNITKTYPKRLVVFSDKE